MKLSGNPEVMALLLQLVKENAGVEVQAGDADSSFFELGLDSLFLTQFSVSLASRFGVKLTFRQLSAQFNTLNKLSVFLDEAAGAGPPSDPAAAHPAPAPASLVNSAASLPAPAALARSRLSAGHRDPLIQLFLGQLDVMQRQLDALAEGAEPDRQSQPAHPATATAGASADAVAAAPDAPGTTSTAPAAAVRERQTPVVGAVLDASRPPAPGARLGRDPSGQPAWFVPRADQPGKYVKLV